MKIFEIIKSCPHFIIFSIKIWFFDVMKPGVVSKILQEALRASCNFSSAHWLHHPMNVKKSNFYS